MAGKLIIDTIQTESSFLQLNVSNTRIATMNASGIYSNTGGKIIGSDGTFGNSTIVNATISSNLNFDSTGTTGFNTATANTVRVHTTGVERVRVDSSGNLGIGTTSPSNYGKLAVNGTIAAGTDQTDQLSLLGGGGTARVEATGGNASVNLSLAAKGGGAVYFWTSGYGGTNTMLIDASGRVTKPLQPAFDAYGTVGSVNFTTEASIALDATTFNVGNHYNTSNYRFTAPVAGMYFFRAHVYKQSSGNASRLRLYKNGSNNRVYQYITASDTYTHQVTAIISLAVGDYVTCTFNSDGGGTQIYLADNHTNFSGYLLG